MNGIELDTTISPIRDLRFTANLTYLDSKFDRFPGGAALVNGSFSTVPVDLTGQRAAGVPEFAVSLATDYTVRLGDANKLMFHVDYQHNSPTQIAQGTVPLQREVNLVNASVTFNLDSKLDLTLWARNLTDEAWVTTIFPGVAQAGTLSGYRNQPRTFGGLVRYRF